MHRIRDKLIITMGARADMALVHAMTNDEIRVISSKDKTLLQWYIETITAQGYRYEENHDLLDYAVDVYIFKDGVGARQRLDYDTYRDEGKRLIEIVKLVKKNNLFLKGETNV